MCKHTQTHIAQSKASSALMRRWWALRLVIALKRCRQYHRTGSGFKRKEEKGALDVAPSVKVNHDGVSLTASPPPGLSYLRQAEEAHSQWKMAWGDGRACVPGIPQYTVDTLLWHLQGQLDRYSVIRMWEKVVLSMRLLWIELSRGKQQSNKRWGELKPGSDAMKYVNMKSKFQYIALILITFRCILKQVSPGKTAIKSLPA